MTSRNSFWARLFENNKRRIWVWLLAGFSYLLVLPAALAMAISREMARKDYLIEEMGDVLGSQIMQEKVIEVAAGFFGLKNVYLAFFAAILAIISAIQGFSYLYSKKKIDFYMGMPVRRRRRFMVIWLNGILVYLIPCVLGLLISGLIAASHGVMTSSVAGEAALAFGLLLAFYLGMYHLAILAVMLTGNVVITCLGTVVFLLYEWAVRMMIQSYQELFFRFFSYEGSDVQPRLSPITILTRFAQMHEKGQGNALVTLLNLLLFAGVIWLVSYMCYLRRPAEAAGRAMAFRFPQAFIKILLVVPAALLSGIVVAQIVNYSPKHGSGSVGFVIFTMAVVTVVSCCLIQILYEFDIVGIVHKKHHILISAAAVAVIFMVFRLDVFGYDTYIPSVESVSSAALIPPYEYRYYGESYFDENWEPVSKTRYAEDNMYLTDVGAVNKLMKVSMEELEEYEDLSSMYGDDKSWYEVTVLFRLNNKRNVYRDIYVNVNNPETARLLDRIEGSQEYIGGIYAGASDHLMNMLAQEDNNISVYYGNQIYEKKLDRQEGRELLALYQEDVRDTYFSKLRESIPAGSFRISVEKKYSTYSSYYNTEVMIYPFFTNCVEYLKERGYYMEHHIDPEDVERIQITNYNNSISIEKQEQWQESMGAEMAEDKIASWNSSDFWRYISVEKEEEVKELCEVIYPQEWLGRSFHMNAQEDRDYAVTVYFKSGSQAAKNNGSVGNYRFENGKVPQFVADATVYQE